jgi:DNA-directed RNA polymerase specialized sigma subunit
MAGRVTTGKVRACCNPDHLEPKSHAKNIRLGKVPKMSEEKVELLRNDLAYGMTQMDAARKYGISQSTVSQIARNMTWR